MKRIVSILLLTVIALTARAQGNIPLLDRVAGQRVSFHYTYSLSQKGAAFEPVTDGDVVVEENAYVLEGLGLKVISDGVTRWSLDLEALEAVVENVEKEDLFTNPALFIGSYKRYMDKIHVNSQSADSLDVTLTLDQETRARFLLTGIRFAPMQGKSDFSVEEKSLPEKYVVTDLR